MKTALSILFSRLRRLQETQSSIDFNRLDESHIRFLEFLKTELSLSDATVTRIRSAMEMAEADFDTIIAQFCHLSEQKIREFFCQHFQRPMYEGQVVDFAASKDANLSFLLRTRTIILSGGQTKKLIGLVDPFSAEVMRAWEFHSSQEFQYLVMTHSEWEEAIKEIIPQASYSPDESLFLDPFDTEQLNELASSEPVIRTVNDLLSQAHSIGASDLHFEMTRHDCLVRVRIDGQLQDKTRLPFERGLSAISRVKVLSDLDIAERRRPQDGRFSQVLNGEPIDIRVSTIAGEYGEGAVLRLLYQSVERLDFGSLGFSSHEQHLIRQMLSMPHGILLVTGPTGSGKTTTLYTCLKELASAERKILTAEDPIELHLPGIMQTQVNPKIDVTFANALRAFLRHDPDVMMVGEIRDLETAKMACQAALTGHLVLSTMHTNSAPAAIDRLRDLGLEDYLIASTLIGVIGQRLVRKSPRAEAKGRFVVSETLKITPRISEAIRSHQSQQTIIDMAPEFISMRDDADSKILSDMTTAEEVQRVLGSVYD